MSNTQDQIRDGMSSWHSCTFEWLKTTVNGMDLYGKIEESVGFKYLKYAAFARHKYVLN